MTTPAKSWRNCTSHGGRRFVSVPPRRQILAPTVPFPLDRCPAMRPAGPGLADSDRPMGSGPLIDRVRRAVRAIDPPCRRPNAYLMSAARATMKV